MGDHKNQGFQNPRHVVKKVLARPQHEGDGAIVRRSIGRWWFLTSPTLVLLLFIIFTWSSPHYLVFSRGELRNLDPFLMLDEFSGDLLDLYSLSFSPCLFLLVMSDSISLRFYVSHAQFLLLRDFLIILIEVWLQFAHCFLVWLYHHVINLYIPCLLPCVNVRFRDRHLHAGGNESAVSETYKSDQNVSWNVILTWDLMELRAPSLTRTSLATKAPSELAICRYNSSEQDFINSCRWLPEFFLSGWPLVEESFTRKCLPGRERTKDCSYGSTSPPKTRCNSSNPLHLVLVPSSSYLTCSSRSSQGWSPDIKNCRAKT